jgi:LmbE family N-acetylglucosaminyl deacetylase
VRASDIQAEWQNLPYGDLETIFGQGRILILAPHPDDESLGCGGLIHESCRAGRPPLVMIVTDGTGSHPHSPSMPARALCALREQETAAALHHLGLDDPSAVVFLRLRDTAAPHDGPCFDAAVERIATLSANCASICAPWRHDPHCDHAAVHMMAEAVAARTRLRHLSYPVWGWTLPAMTQLPQAHVTGWRLDITANIVAKQRAIDAHRSQHGAVIMDDPRAFHLPVTLLRIFRNPYEVYLCE